MTHSIGRIALDCFIDLGIAVIYATLAGLLIVGIVASDDGLGSLVRSALYASLLPASVTVLIGCDVVLRVLSERRAARRFVGVRTHEHGLKLSRP